MSQPKRSSQVYRFGVFEFDPVASELRKRGIKLKLQGQPLDILAMLLERPGDVVTREDLQKRLWASGTFVDFDHSLNAAMMRLRSVLDDSAETPRYVETLARRGYRFITPVDSPAMSVRIEIEESLDAPAVPEPSAAGNGIRALSRRPLIVMVEALLLVAVIMSLVVWNLKTSRPEPVTRFAITLPAGQRLAELDQSILALSPDGAKLAYVGMQSGNQQLYLRAMDSLEAGPIPNTEGAVNPFFSPDGQWLGFFADGKLKKISMNGGAALTLADAADPGGASWSSQGLITFAPSKVSGLQQVSDSGGTTQLMTRLENTQVSHRWPEILLGNKALLFASGMARLYFTNPQVAVQLIGTGERRTLIQAGTNPRYAPSGHLIYGQGGTLMAVPFDPRRLLVTGTAVPVVEGVQQSRWTGAVQYSFSATGSLVYVPGSIRGAQSRLVWVSRNGAEQPWPAPARAYSHPQLSPDGRRVAVAIEEQESQVWVYDLTRETLTRLTFNGNRNYSSAWTPDGQRIAFQSNKEGASNIFWQLADGSGGLERLTRSEYTHNPISWSPDGQLLAFSEVNPDTGFDIWVLRLRDRKAQPFLRTPSNESAPRFSPDGHWLAYVSNESGRNEIYVQPYPGPGGKWQISTEGGGEPLWNSNGRELFYRTGNKMMAVGIDTRPSFSAGKPRLLFEGKYQPPPFTSPNYDVTSDGQRFLMLKPSESTETARAQINVVLNWFEELKRRVPSGTK